MLRQSDPKGGSAGPADVPPVRHWSARRSRRCSAGACPPRRARRSARRCSTRTPPSSGRRSGEKVILVRRETNPDDLNGMIAAEGILTSRGGKTSHAAVVARGWARRACAAPRSSRSTPSAPDDRPGRRVVEEGDVISVDGSSGRCTSVRCRWSPRRWSSTSRARWTPGGPTTNWSRACTGSWRADETRRLRVRANADTVEDAERARRFGAAGDRAVPHRAHVPRRAAPARRAADPGRGRRAARAGARRAAPVAAGTSWRSSPRWTGCRRRSGCWTRRCTSSCPTSPSCRYGWRWPSRGRSRRERPAAHAGRALAARAEPDARACAGCGWGWSCPGCSTMQVRAIAEAAAAADQVRAATRSRRS